MRTASLFVAVLAIAGLSGCAGSTSSNLRADAAPSGGFNSDVDWAKVHYITDDANRKGYKIVWVHPPQKRGQPSSN